MIYSIIKSILGNWQVALGAIGLLILSHTLTYCEGRSDGRESVKAELRIAEAKAAENALKAAARADEKALQREEAEAEAVGDLIKQIEEAEANDENPLDALFR